MAKAREVWQSKGLRGFLRWVVVKRIGKPLFRRMDSVFARTSLVGNDPVLDPGLFAFTAKLESSWETVRDELLPLLAEREHIPPVRSLQPDQDKTARDDGWRSFVLHGYGFRSDYGCERCPETTRLLESVPGLTSAFFSVLAPGTHIARHAGVTKAVVRCHLPLVVPRDAEKCRMVVRDELVVWQEGHCVYFDDSEKHEVWNDTPEERVVLIFDFYRPMRAPGPLFGRLLHAILRVSPFVRTSRRNLERWEAERLAEAA